MLDATAFDGDEFPSDVDRDHCVSMIRVENISEQRDRNSSMYANKYVVLPGVRYRYKKANFFARTTWERLCYVW